MPGLCRANSTTCWPVPLPTSSTSPDLPARKGARAEHEVGVEDVVRPPQYLMARLVGQGDGPVVEGIAGLVAPAVAGCQRQQGEARRRRRQAVRPIEQPAKDKAPRRGGAVALALLR